MVRKILNFIAVYLNKRRKRIFRNFEVFKSIAKQGISVAYYHTDDDPSVLQERDSITSQQMKGTYPYCEKETETKTSEIFRSSPSVI